MNMQTTHNLLRAVSLIVLILMLLAIVYSAWISLTYWSGIGV